MLACVSASDADLNETISTLVYANRARNIRNRVVVNHDYNDSSSAEVAKLRAEVNRLKMENSAFRAMGGAGPAAELDQRRAAEEIKSLRGEVGRLRERLNENNEQLITTLAERDTLLVEREVTGDSNIEAHPIMATYHRTVMQLKDRLIAAEDQALELQTLLTQKPNSVFGRRPQATSPRRKGAASPFRKRLDHLTTDDDHDADGEQDGRKDGSPGRGRQPKRRSRQSSRAVSRFDFGANAALTNAEPSKLPMVPPMPQVEQILSGGGASSWFQNLKAEESAPLSASCLDYTSSGSSLLQKHISPDSDSSDLSRRRRARAGMGAGDSVDKAKEDIRRGLLLLKAEKNGVGMDMELLNLLDPSGSTLPVKPPSHSSGRRRDSMTSSMSSGSSRSRFQILPTLEDTANGISPMRAAFPPFPLPPGQMSWKESQSPLDTKVFFEAEQKAAETLANAMKAMHRFSFPLSGDSLSISQQQQQSRLNAAIQLQKAAGVPLPDSDSGSLVDTASLVGSISGRSGRSARFATAPSVDFSIAIQSERSRHSRQSGQSGQSGRSGNSGSNRSGPQDGDTLISEARRLSEAAVAAVDNEELSNKLERAEMEIHKLQMHYQQEIHVLEDRIREAEIEHTNKIPGTAKVKYEAKIKQLMTQLSDLEHKYNEVSKVANEKRSANESQLKSLRTTVETLKLEKQRMIKRMKEDAERLKEINAANDRELQALRRAEKAASDARKKAESELQQQQQQLQQQQRNAAMHRSTGSSSTQQAKMNGLLKKPQTPKGISKAPRRGAPRMASPERAPEPPKRARKGSIRMQVSQKKQVIDRAIYGYISGQHTINVMEDLLRKRQRLRNEKQELEQERERVVLAQEESAITNGTDPLDFASEPQYMDDRINMIDAEVAYINARIRALQAEAAALGFVTTIEKVGDSDGADEEELMTKLIRQGMANDAMGLPPGSGAVGAFESSLQILRSLDVNEARDFVEMLFEDIVSVRTNENALYVQATNQEKVIEELKRALQTMRQKAVKRCDGLEQKLRALGGSPDPASGPRLDGSSEDEHDAEVARLSVRFADGNMPSPVLSSSRRGSKDSLFTPVPDGAQPRTGSAAEAVLDDKSKRVSTIFDELYENAIKTSDETTPKVGGTAGEFSRLLMANTNGRRVSWTGIPPMNELPALHEHELEHVPEHPSQPTAPTRPRLNRSVSSSSLGSKSATETRPLKSHRRTGSTSSGSGNSQVLPNGRNASSMSRTSSEALRSTAGTISRRSSTPSVVPAVGPKSAARNRNSAVLSSNADAPAPSAPAPHPRRPELTINTSRLRHSQSHAQLRSDRVTVDRRSSTPTPSAAPPRRVLRSDSEGANVSGGGFAGQTMASQARHQITRPPSRAGGAPIPSPGFDLGDHHNTNSRRVSGPYDDHHSSVFDRLASGHTQASQSRVLTGPKHAPAHPQPQTPAGGSMMTSNGNMSSQGFQQIQQQSLRHRPSVDGFVGMYAQGERPLDERSESSLTSSSQSDHFAGMEVY